MSGAKHARGRAASDPQPNTRLGVDAHQRNPSNIVDVVFDEPSKKLHARRVRHVARRRDLFWVLILYLIAVIGALAAAGVYLLSQ